MEAIKTLSNSNNSNKSLKHHNHLKNEKSPYLLQHASNPVDWYPWGEEAFEKARKEDKLIFLSIGYSTCHWCHVMAHESFEDLEVAKIMNEIFVSIKVDREERPDLDNIYMRVCQMLTGSGGWPLTIVMTPDKKPFFVGTYFPKKSRFGRMGMLELLPRLSDFWKTKREQVLESAKEILDRLQQSSDDAPGEELQEDMLAAAFKGHELLFDEQYGGFKGAPKFPTPHRLLFLLRYWKRTGDKKALSIVEKTLQSMRLGGIFDHIGFGFHRYSTDFSWLLPHFEKMLYDQALLAIAYIETYQATKKEEYRKTAEEIFSYVLRDMVSPAGGFYSAEDADSEGEEGKFYVWTEEEIRKVLEKEEADLVIKIFSIEKDGNYYDEATRRKTGKNILHLKKPLTEISSQLNVSEEKFRRRLETIRQKLLAIREKRIPPHKDDKILTDWNGLMIAALARGAQAFDEVKYGEAAKRTVSFIFEKLQKSNGRLLHRYRDGEAAITANVTDFAFLIWGLIELYETTFDASYLQKALELNNDLIKHFWDEKAGGFYFTPDDGEKLLVRNKEIYDGAIPSGNSVAMWNLLRLARITANTEFEEKAAQISQTFSKVVGQSPIAYTMLLVGLDFAFGPTYEVVIAGNSKEKDTREMLRAIRTQFIPNKIVLLHPTEEESPEIFRIADFVKFKSSKEGKATAHVCINRFCRFPTTEISRMLELLNVKK